MRGINAESAIDANTLFMNRVWIESEADWLLDNIEFGGNFYDLELAPCKVFNFRQ